jgi:hypothetical protein
MRSSIGEDVKKTIGSKKTVRLDRTTCRICATASISRENAKFLNRRLLLKAPEWLCPAVPIGNGGPTKRPPKDCPFIAEHAAAAQPDVDPAKWAKLAKKAGAKPVDFE